MPRFLTEVLTWRDHEWIRPAVKTAIQSGLTPSALLLEDPSRTEYTRWDLRIINAVHMLDTYSIDGIPVWLEESPDVQFEAKKHVYRSAQALEKAQERDQKKRTKSDGSVTPAFGERWYVEPKYTSDRRPTFESWLQEQSGAAVERPIDEVPFEELTKAERQERVRREKIARARPPGQSPVQ